MSISGNVDLLKTFVTDLGENQFLATGGGGIYNITSGTATALKTGLPSNPWDPVTFNNRLIFMNGTVVPQEYNGSTISNASFTGYPNPERFFAGHVFKNRVFYAATGELAFWYTELFASTGTLTKFPLAGIAERGGSVVSINSWTVDGGSGPDDYLAIFTSEGEVLVYQGTNPGRDFFIIGRFYIANIVHNSGIEQIYGKLFVVTERDYIYLPDQLAVQGGGRDTKLSGAAAAATAKYKNLRGWQSFYSPNEGLMIVNVPTSNSTSEQHVTNVKTGAATRFTGLNAQSWGEFNGQLYFGGNDGTVNKYTGTSDAGGPITCTAQAAPSALRSNSEKQVTSYRPGIKSQGTITMSSGLGYDFDPIEFKQSTTLSADTSATLPLAWPFNWSTDNGRREEWQRGSGRGTAVQLFLQTTTAADVSWLGTDYIAEPGGLLR
jgi:hypothetical protein